MGDSSQLGKFIMLLTLKRSSYRENATLQATFFTRSICQDLNELLNIPQMCKRPKKEQTNTQTNKQTDKLTAEHYTPAAHACARVTNSALTTHTTNWPSTAGLAFQKFLFNRSTIYTYPRLPHLWFYGKLYSHPVTALQPAAIHR